MNPRFILAAVSTLLLFNGCRKLDINDPGRDCRILETSTRIFTYDEFGNPSRFAYKEDPDATGRATFRFKYDAQHRLIGYNGFNDHMLTLDEHGRPVIDTFIMNYAGQDERFIVRIYYDLLGRVSKQISAHYFSQGEELPLPHHKDTTSYRYDIRGNLILPDFDGVGNVEYDNKRSILRTNPILMFINRNYSINNPKIPATYNAKALPDTWHGVFLESEGTHTNIIYDCTDK